MNNASTMITINIETLRQALKTEKELWAPLRQYFNLNQELIENLAGEQVFGIGCFAGLLSFINCGTLYKHQGVVEFIAFEKRNPAYQKILRIIEGTGKITQNQLELLINHHLHRSYRVEHFVEAVIEQINENNGE